MYDQSSGGSLSAISTKLTCGRSTFLFGPLARVYCHVARGLFSRGVSWTLTHYVLALS